MVWIALLWLVFGVVLVEAIALGLVIFLDWLLGINKREQ